MRITIELQRTRHTAVMESARLWWESLRPAGWDLQDHLHAPTINTVTESQKTLAQAVAGAIEVGAL